MFEDENDIIFQSEPISVIIGEQNEIMNIAFQYIAWRHNIVLFHADFSFFIVFCLYLISINHI